MLTQIQREKIQKMMEDSFKANLEQYDVVAREPGDMPIDSESEPSPECEGEPQLNGGGGPSHELRLHHAQGVRYPRQSMASISRLEPVA